MKTGTWVKFKYGKWNELLRLNSLNQCFTNTKKLKQRRVREKKSKNTMLVSSDDNGDNKDDTTDIADVVDDSNHSLVAPWRSGYHYYTT